MEKPALFIASSVEGLTVAEAINANLDHDTHPTLWRAGTFKLGSGALEDLVKKSSTIDFAVFVFTPDDIVTIRKQEIAVARDNVVFELGLFIGALGKERCYVVKPRGVEMHLPSDLLGITTADYVADRPDGDIASALNSACKEIKDQIKALGKIPKPAPGQSTSQRRHVANPPEYKLKNTDLQFLAECARSYVACPQGMGYFEILTRLKRESEPTLHISAIKLLRLGYVEKTVEHDQRDGEEYFAYRITDDGLEAFLKNEDSFAVASTQPLREKNRSLAVSTGFNDMDPDIPF